MNSTLLPYLQTSPPHLCLIISQPSDGSVTLEKTNFPFLVVIDSDPLSRFIEARFATDAGSELKKVFLLVQRDQYLLKRDELWPINNKDIDRFWQQAFSFYTGKKEETSFPILAHQINENGTLRPLQSLFFCRTRQLFFPPVCPRCGLPLEQPYDDDLLRRSGLQAYSTSLKRYLFCPSCFAKKEYEFYVYELDRLDPPQIKDRSALIHGFSKLQENRYPENMFPCPACSYKSECYGPDRLALSRIAPFSFYPFFMFIFEATSVLHAMEFLPLISGATFSEVEAQLEAKREFGRIHCLKGIQRDPAQKIHNLLEGSDKYFGEVFYLKLSFLSELILHVASAGGFTKHPDLRLSIDRIWVKLANAGNLLPFLWNFRIGFMDIGRNLQEGRCSPSSPGSDGLSFFSRLWFYTLLVNKRQSVSKVYDTLGETMEQLSSDASTPFEAYLRKGFHAVFSPKNIFWDPEGKVVKKSWGPLWEKALCLGWSLMEGRQEKGSPWKEDEFLRQLEELRTGVRENLFQERPADKEPPDDSSENEAILRILEQIQQKWRREFEPEGEEIVETIIISTKDLKKESSPTQSPKKGEPGEPPDTVIIPSYSKIRTDEDIPETVIIPLASQTKSSPVSSAPGRGEDSGVPEREASKQRAEKLEINRKKREEPEEDVMSETVILEPKEKGRHGSQK